MEPSPKAQSESVESVRSKLRESLAGALALVCQQRSKPLAVGNAVQNVAPSPPSEVSQDFPTVKPSDANVGAFDGQRHIYSDNEASFANKVIAKDQLVQGHGICWAADLDSKGSEESDRDPKRRKIVEEEITPEHEQVLSSPLSLANEIEAELFKLFGGVNKKYKEKGRSLLFNLKDRNNPELRERVMTGDISPARLCAMTAEELASKELSLWRIAKAEELAQMVVLPDAEVDFRRLVKKTHKGEFQVEVDQGDNISVEVAVGTTFTQNLSRSSETEGKMAPKSDEPESRTSDRTNKMEFSQANTSFKVDTADQSDPGKLITVSRNGTDLMQQFVVDDIKDGEFLPSIVSLDEFMESLDSEHPFENLQNDSFRDTAVERGTESLRSRLDHSIVGAVQTAETATIDPNEIENKYKRTGSSLNSSDSHVEYEILKNSGDIKGEQVWEGLVQLNISAIAMVAGFYKSGEKTSTKDWLSMLEIKGRVRLDAFEKFVHDLQMSRSRAIMIVQFSWKEGSPEEGRLHMLEVADSYVADERVGFAEPAPGIELYLCPPHRKMIEMLCMHLPKHTDSLVSIENGLIGIIVWRKVTTDSPRGSSLQRQNSKKHHSSSSKRQQEKDAFASPKQTLPPIPGPPPPFNPDPPSDENLNDDIPPGFGPAVAAEKDEEDLPEFDFANSSRSPVSCFQGADLPQRSGMAGPVPQAQLPPSRPMNEMRDLVNKYGLGKAGSTEAQRQPGRVLELETEPWNDDDDDDDDDMPEWRPQQEARPSLPPPPPLHGIRPDSLPTLYNGQQLAAMPNKQCQPLVRPAAPLPMHLQPASPQFGSLQSQRMMDAPRQVGVPGFPPLPGGALEIRFHANGPGQPQCHIGSAQPAYGQFFRPPGHGVVQPGVDWRPNVPRSRGV